MIKKIWKLLLTNEFYEKHKHEIPVASFDSIGQQLMPTLIKAQETLKRDITTEELYGLYCSDNPTSTTAARASVDAYLHNVRNEPAIGADVADIVLASMWKQEVARVISEYGIRFGEGEHEDVAQLSRYLASINGTFIPDDFDEPVDTDPMAMFKELSSVGKWNFSIPSLNAKMGKVSPGMFITLLGRPDSGKSALAVDLVASRDGFAAQGANTHYICNEEAGLRTAARMACCYNQLSVHDVMRNPAIAKTDGWEAVRKNITVVHKPDMNINQLENYIKKHKPDVLILDQIDHIQVSKTFESGHERLGMLYRRARELCSIYNNVTISVTQASAEAEGKTVVTYAMAEGSRTSKAATADAIIGIGRSDTDEGDIVTRYLNLSKNKISGYKGTIVTKLIQSESRFIA